MFKDTLYEEDVKLEMKSDSCPSNRAAAKCEFKVGFGCYAEPLNSMRELKLKTNSCEVKEAGVLNSKEGEPALTIESCAEHCETKFHMR